MRSVRKRGARRFAAGWAVTTGALLLAACMPIGPRTVKGHWFWIDESDWRTKRTLVLVILLFTLTDTGSPERLPVLTIPTN